jgi:hypothetical protein
MMKLVQCWDDGVNDDIRLTQILRKHGAKATFNLNPTSHKAQRHGHFRDKPTGSGRKLAIKTMISSIFTLIANLQPDPIDMTQKALLGRLPEPASAVK